jgi:hypothetical protein
MPDILIDKIGEITAKIEISFNQLVVQCCEYALAHLNENEESQ